MYFVSNRQLLLTYVIYSAMMIVALAIKIANTEKGKTMKNYDIVIIGGSAAGATAATTARKHYPNKSILSIRDAKSVPIPCGIPYIYGTVGDAMKNLIPVDNMMGAANIDVLVDPVVKINQEFNLVLTAAGETVHYERLVIATGSHPVVLPIEGMSLPNVFPIRKDVNYLQTMQSELVKAKDIVVIGCGFIGAEMAEECKKSNPEKNVRVVEVLDHALQVAFDPEFSALADKALTDQGIELLMNQKVVKIVGVKKPESVLLESGVSLPADLVILGLGSVPNTDLAIGAGLKIGPAKGLCVNRYMQTSDSSIFACGDCADKVSFFDHKPSALRLASIATMEARIAGANLFALKRANDGVVGCFSTVLNKKAFAVAGLTATEANKKGYAIVVGEAESINRHPGLMPGGDLLKVKLVFEKGTGLLLGGQLYGALSAGELINAISAFVSNRMTADDLATFQAGTHPALTASPIAYQLVNAAENAVAKLSQ